jgi:hypothetical protein
MARATTTGDPLAQTNVVTWNGRDGDVVMTPEDITEAGGVLQDSPHLLGAPTAPTPVPDANGTEIATAAFVKQAIAAGGGGGETGFSPLQAVPPLTGSLLITCVYNGNEEDGAAPGLAWCHLFDNPVYAWMVDPAGSPIYPVILGTLPDWTPPPTGDIESPRWAVREQREIFIPDTARGDMHSFLNYIAYNNGARRQLYADFSDTMLAAAWISWASANPGNALREPPNPVNARLA